MYNHILLYSEVPYLSYFIMILICAIPFLKDCHFEFKNRVQYLVGLIWINCVVITFWLESDVYIPQLL